MRVTDLYAARSLSRRAAIGFFDGAHLGRQTVIAGRETVITFDPHPLSVVRPAAAPCLITCTAERLPRIAALGVAETVVIPFDHARASQSPRSFVDDVLVAALHVTHISVGENFRYGAAAAGGIADLLADHRLSTWVIPLRTSGEAAILSTRIRGLVTDGSVDEAIRLLGGPLTHPAKLKRKGGSVWLDIDPALAAPTHGSYLGRVAGCPVAVTAHGASFDLVTGDIAMLGRYGSDPVSCEFQRELREAH